MTQPQPQPQPQPEVIDLFATGKRPNYRLSELAGCNFAIAHNIIGTKIERSAKSSFFPNHKRNVALWMGDALEPVINRFLIEECGLTLKFYNNDQLEPIGDGPRRIGHSDGIVYLAAPSDLTDFARYNMRSEAVRDLLEGRVMVLENKTMRDADFKLFAKAGGDFRASYWISKYPTQVASYLQILSNPEYDHLWPDTYRGSRDGRATETFIGSRDFRAFLADIGREAPTTALAAVLNTATKDFGFGYIDYADEEANLTARLAELSEIRDLMGQGQLPEPSFDGRAPDCFNCPYTSICPSVKKLIDDLNTEQVFPEFSSEALKVDIAQFDDDAEEYITLKEQADEIADRLKVVREKMKGSLVTGSSFRTDRFSIAYSEVSGRQSADMTTLGRNISDLKDTINAVVSSGHIDLSTSACMYCDHDQPLLYESDWLPEADADMIANNKAEPWIAGARVMAFLDTDDPDNDVLTVHTRGCALIRLYDHRTFAIPMKRGGGHDRLYIRPLYGPTSNADTKDGD